MAKRKKAPKRPTAAQKRRIIAEEVLIAVQNISDRGALEGDVKVITDAVVAVTPIISYAIRSALARREADATRSASSMRQAAGRAAKTSRKVTRVQV